jgi:hypothetical protein
LDVFIRLLSEVLERKEKAIQQVVANFIAL